MSTLLSRIGRRRAVQGTVAGAVVLGLLLWWLLPLGEKPPSGTITFSTGTRAGVYQKYGELLRTELRKDMPGLDVRLKTSAGSQENVERVASGEADFTIAAADAVETYKLAGSPGAEGLRGVTRLYDDYVQLVVPSDSDIQSVRDLRGKRVAIGLPNSGVRLIATRLLKAVGIDPETDITPRADGIDTGPGRLGDELDAFFWSGGVPTDGLKEIAESSAFRFVPIGDDLVTKLHRSGGATRYYRTTNMPESAYPTVRVSHSVSRGSTSARVTSRLDTAIVGTTAPFWTVG